MASPISGIAADAAINTPLWNSYPMIIPVVSGLHCRVYVITAQEIDGQSQVALAATISLEKAFLLQYMPTNSIGN